MTSSLVGSEMCIRDREILCAQMWKSFSGTAMDEQQRFRIETSVVGIVTVSYTHLTLPTICSV
eukprot:4815814-Prorocentrum_lima.AAC.1